MIKISCADDYAARLSILLFESDCYIQIEKRRFFLSNNNQPYIRSKISYKIDRARSPQSKTKCEKKKIKI